MVPYHCQVGWGYADLSGKVVIPCQYNEARFFDNGFARVRKGDRWHIINEAGKEILDIGSDPFDFMEHQSRWDTRNNVWIASFGKFGTGTWGVADKSGKALLAPEYTSVQIVEPSGNMYAAFTSKKITLFTRDFKVIIDDLQQIGWMDNNIMMIKKNGKFGYIDGDGVIVVPFHFSEATDFVDGYARVKKDDRVGYINMDGSWKYELRGTAITTATQKGIEEGGSMKTFPKWFLVADGPMKKMIYDDLGKKRFEVEADRLTVLHEYGTPVFYVANNNDANVAYTADGELLKYRGIKFIIPESDFKEAGRKYPLIYQTENGSVIFGKGFMLDDGYEVKGRVDGFPVFAKKNGMPYFIKNDGSVMELDRNIISVKPFGGRETAGVHLRNGDRFMISRSGEIIKPEPQEPVDPNEPLIFSHTYAASFDSGEVVITRLTDEEEILRVEDRIDRVNILLDVGVILIGANPYASENLAAHEWGEVMEEDDWGFKREDLPRLRIYDLSGKKIYEHKNAQYYIPDGWHSLVVFYKDKRNNTKVRVLASTTSVISEGDANQILATEVEGFLWTPNTGYIGRNGVLFWE